MLTSLPALLLLPLRIRERIYSLVGLTRSCPISIDDESLRWSRLAHVLDKHHYSNYGKHKKRIMRDQIRLHQCLGCVFDSKSIIKHTRPPGTGCLHDNIPTQIFLISRELYKDTIQFLYARNVILLGPALLRIPVIALGLLTSLQVRLTSCSCIAGHYCPNLKEYTEFDSCKSCHALCKRGNGNPLYRNRDRDILTRWHKLCVAIRDNCSASLNFTFICDCVDLDTALEATQFLDSFPTLKSVNIRLGQTPYSALGDLAIKVANRLSGKREVQFPFKRLPLELQELIFQHTDLVAPDYISWHETIRTKCYFHMEPLIASKSRGFQLLFGSIQNCCMRCTTSNEVCSCPGRHAAYTSNNCSCWSFPRPLFLVSKDIYHLANRTFYSNNKFVLWETSRIQYDQQQQPNYLSETIHILRQIPDHIAYHIRWLRFLIPKFLSTDGHETSPTHSSWVSLTNLLKQRYLSPRQNLTVELDFAHYKGTEERHFSLTPEALVPDSLTSLRNIAHLFIPDLNEQLQNYKSFFLRFAFTALTMEYDIARWNLERELECAIMRSEVYDPVAAGKYTDRNSYYNEAIRPKVVAYYSSGWWPDDDESLYLP